MKLLQQQFTKLCDGLGEFSFTQIKKDGNVFLYKRCYSDGKFHSYEVFLTKPILKGTKLPGGAVVEEDYQPYTTANKGGFNCRFICDPDEDNALERAEIAFKEIVDHVKENKDNAEANGDVIGKRGRVAKIRPILNFPSNKEFTLKDIMAVNTDYSQSIIYTTVKEEIKKNKIKLLRREKLAGNKGKPSCIYTCLK